MAALEIRGLTKRFGDTDAVRDLDLTVEEGEVFGVLGPNGAGKSTTIDTLVDFVRPTDGAVTVSGRNPREDPLGVREAIGYLPDDYGLYDQLTGREHVAFAIAMNAGDDDPDAILDRVGLAAAGDRPAGSYSKGMGQRLALGMALAGDPNVLILDEPSSGIDPNGVDELQAILREEADRGTTILLSSHVLERVEAICDRVGIIDDGELVAVDTVAGLRSTVDDRSTIRLSVDDEPPIRRVAALDGVANVERADGTLEVECTAAAKSAVIAAVEADGTSVIDVEIEAPSLADLFDTLTTGGGSE